MEAVLFDWGDTLAGFPWSDEIFREGALAGLAAIAEREDLPDVEAIAALFADLDDDREDEVVLDDLLLRLLSQDEIERYLPAAYEIWHGYAGVAAHAHALLESLRARDLKLAIVSNGVTPACYLHQLMERQGLAERVDAIVLSSEVGKRKPHPLLFERALEALGVLPARAAFVGDRLFHDISGAARLGMITIQALWFRADDHPDGGEPDFQAFTPYDVLNVVRRLNGER